jgi:hypothetical protein
MISSEKLNVFVVVFKINMGLVLASRFQVQGPLLPRHLREQDSFLRSISYVQEDLAHIV